MAESDEDFGAISTNSYMVVDRAIACEWCDEIIEVGDDAFNDGSGQVEGDYCSESCLEMMAENMGIY